MIEKISKMIWIDRNVLNVNRCGEYKTKYIPFNMSGLHYMLS